MHPVRQTQEVIRTKISEKAFQFIERSMFLQRQYLELEKHITVVFFAFIGSDSEKHGG